MSFVDEIFDDDDVLDSLSEGCSSVDAECEEFTDAEISLITDNDDVDDEILAALGDDVRCYGDTEL